MSRPVVNVVDPAAAGAVRAAGATARIVARSNAQLESVVAGLDRTVRVANTAWAVDPVTNQVVVTVAEAVPAAEQARVRAALGKFGDAVRVETAPGAFELMIYGGDEIVADRGRSCSSGFVVVRNGYYLILSAGHCTRDLPRWSAEGRALGPSTSSDFPGSDRGLIRLDGSYPQESVNLYDGTFQHVQSAADGVVGQTVCKSGRTTRVTCGRITALGATVNYDNGRLVFGLTRTTARARAGDSGGPFFDGSTGLGVTSGGNATTTFFEPLPRALAAYNARLKDGGGGDGVAVGVLAGPGGRCAGIRGGSQVDGAPIELAECATAQQWVGNHSALQTFEKKCIDVRLGGTANGTPAQLWECNATDEQVWVGTLDGRRINKRSGRCLDVSGADPAIGTQLVIADCTGAANQQWRLVPRW